MRKTLEKYQNWIAGAAAFALFVMAVFTIHDMQFAEGVGLYFALKAEKDRLLFDVSVDGLAAAALLFLVTLPCLLLKRREMTARLRFLIAFLAFMPALSMAYLIHPMQEETEITLSSPVYVLQMILPFLCLLAAGVAISQGEKVWKRWYSLCCAGAALLFAAALLVPNLQQLLYFFIVYLLLLICFDLWERLWLKYPALNTWGWILFGGLFLRAFYVLSEVMRRY